MNRKYTLLLFALLLILPEMGYTQISGPSTGTVGTPVNFSTPGIGSSYNWTVAATSRNVNPMSYTPVSTTVSANMGISPNQVKMVFDGTNWYSFTASAMNGSIARLSYGPDPRNATPTLTTLTTTIPVMSGNITKAIDVVYDSASAKWYIFVAHGYARFNKLTMGASGLADLAPTLDTIPLRTTGGAYTTFNVADQLVVKKYNGEWLAFVGGTDNPGNGEFVRLDLGTSLTALNMSTPLVKNNLGNYAKYFSLYQEGNEWFVFASRGATAITFWRTELGNNLKNNTPVAAVELTSSITGATSTRGVLLVRGCNNQLYGYVMSSRNSGGWQVLNFGTSIKNTPALEGKHNVTTLPITADGIAGVSAFVYQDTLYAAISGWGAGNHMYTARLLPLTGSQTRHHTGSYQHTFTAPGTYTVNVLVDQGGHAGPSAHCHTITVAVTSGPAQPDRYAAAPATVCQGQQAVTYTVPAVTNAVAYRWHYTGNNVGFTASTAQPSNSLNFAANATGGSLRVWAVDSNGDSSASSRDTGISVTILPSVSITPATVTICAGQSTMLTASGATTYSWSPTGGSTAVATVSPGTTTTYTVTGTSSGCSTTATRQVVVTPLPNLSISPATVAICVGESTMLTAAGATTYSWSPTGGSNAAAIVSPANTTTYTVTGTSSGCSSTVSRQVMVNQLPATQITVTGGLSEVCAGDSVLLSASGSGYSYTWKDASGAVVGNNQQYAAYHTGGYKVVATEVATGCNDSTQPVDVRVYDRPAVSLDQADTSFCIGGIVTVEVATQDTGLIYMWKKDESTISLATAYFLEINGSGVYKAIVGRSSVASCEDSTNEVTVTVHDLPVVNTTWDGEVLHATPGYVSYQWNTGNQGMPGATDTAFIPSANGGYSVTVTDSNGCENTSAVQQLTNVSVGTVVTEMISVHPNPSGGTVYIETPARVDVLLLSVDGRLLQHVTDAHQLDLSGYANGVYLLRMMDAGGVVIGTARVMKQ